MLSKEELQARTDILLETYSLAVNIEALTMVSIAQRQIAPAVEQYCQSLAGTVAALSEAKAGAKTPTAKLKKVCGLLDDLADRGADLEKAIAEAKGLGDILEKATAYRDSVAPAMKALRKAADELETLVDAEVWPLPTYGQMFFMR